jgi:hypothetical protein
MVFGSHAVFPEGLLLAGWHIYARRLGIWGQPPVMLLNSFVPSSLNRFVHSSLAPPLLQEPVA